jgi:hypothetical protein
MEGTVPEDMLAGTSQLQAMETTHSLSQQCSLTGVGQAKPGPMAQTTSAGPCFCLGPGWWPLQGMSEGHHTSKISSLGRREKLPWQHVPGGSVDGGWGPNWA